MNACEVTPRVRFGWLRDWRWVRVNVSQPEAEIASLRASLDDARAEIDRLSGEKHARDVALRRVIEAAESVHRPKGERGGE